MRRGRDPVLGRELPAWLAAGLVLAVGAGAFLYERKRPLRRQTQGKARRDVRNLALAALSAGAISLAEKPIAGALSRRAHARGRGLVPRLGLPAWAEVLLAVALMDYTLYVWHVLTHKVPLLARFHRVHHADLDMDAATAVRFHFGEMLLSVPWRAAQIALIGTAPLSLSAWTTLTTMAILFHHSNSRLPLRLERRLSRLIVTPRMHGIHHSIVEDETDANWSTIFSWPDRLHGTARLNVPQDAVTIGLPVIRDPSRLTLPKLLAMPLSAGAPARERPRSLASRERPATVPRTVLAP